jgi:excisionase family DNA binding protein
MTISGLPEAEALVVSPKAACRMLACSLTRLYELLNSKEIQSYRDGKSRRILVASLKSYVARQCAVEETKPSRGWTDRATKVRMSRRTLASSSGD